MKLVFKYLKPFAALLLVCLLLLFGEAMCDLSLPTLMSDIVNVGVQQGGVEEGAPEAVSLQGMTLLQTFMTDEDRALTDDGYYTIEPGSSEARRLSERYPLVQEKAVCVRREGLSEEQTAQLDAVYGKAAYAFMLYMQEARETGELEETAWRFSAPQAENKAPGEVGENLRDFSSREESSLPEGVLGSIPDDALFDMPDASSAPAEQERAADGAVMMDSRERTFGEEGGGEETDGDDGTAFDFSSADGFSDVDMEQIYALLPLLAQAPRESIDSAIETAGKTDSMMGGQVGVTFKRIFYEELGMDTDEIQSGYIWGTGLKMLGVALLGVAATVLVGLFSSRIAATVGKRLRHDLFAKVESFSNAEFDKFSTASLITRTTNDVRQVQTMITMGIRLVCYAPIIGVGGVVFAVRKSVSMSWIVAAAVVVLIGLIMVAYALVMPKFKSLQKLVDKVNLVSRENLSGMMVVRAFGNERHEEERFDRANRDLTDTNRYIDRAFAVMMPVMMFIMNLMSIVIVWAGGHAIERSTLQVGDMLAFIQYAMQIISAFLMLAATFILLPRAGVSAARIGEVLDTELTIKDPEQPATLENVRGEIEFRDVSFRYGGAEDNVLEHISFTARPGETTAIIGATGAGKSTLLNLIPRFYDVTGGEVDLDGVDVRRLSQKELREAIGYVPQKGTLFSGTISSNLRYGREDADDGELWRAIETAQASDFVGELGDREGAGGLEHAVSQGGTNVSGGQRQRLSIARALVRNAPIYLFDDSFSALDFKTDAALRRALREKTARSTVIIVAQRVSTIMHAEQILVLDGGKLVGRGAHRELLRTCPEYREIAESQLRKEELE